MKTRRPEVGDVWEAHTVDGEPLLAVLVTKADQWTFLGVPLAVYPAYQPSEAIQVGVVETFTSDWFVEGGSLLSGAR